MEITIRKATIDDLAAILKFNKALFDYETVFNDEYNLDWTYSDTGQLYFKKRLENDATIALVAEVGGKAVGYILAFINTYSFRKVNPNAKAIDFYRSCGFEDFEAVLEMGLD